MCNFIQKEIIYMWRQNLNFWIIKRKKRKKKPNYMAIGKGHESVTFIRFVLKIFELVTRKPQIN